MTYAYFLDQITDQTPQQVSKNVTLIGEISKQQRKKWRKTRSAIGMSCALKGQNIKSGFNLWPLIKGSIPKKIKDPKAAAQRILNRVLLYGYPGEFQSRKESIPSNQKGQTIWTQDFEFTPGKANANEVYAGIIATLWAGRTLLGKKARIIPVPASSLFKNLGQPNIDRIFKQEGYLKALNLRNLSETNPDPASKGQWNVLSVLKHNNLIDGFLGQQYSQNNPDALPGSIANDTVRFHPDTPLPYAILSGVSQLRNTTVGQRPWPSAYAETMPFKAGIYFPAEISAKQSDFKPKRFLTPTSIPITTNALAQIFATSDAFRALKQETRDLRQHPVLGGISSTRWTAYEAFTSQEPELSAYLEKQNTFSHIVEATQSNPVQLRQQGVLVGDESNNVLFGSKSDDLIIGHGGDDRLNGKGGDDWLFGGSGADRFVIPKSRTNLTTENSVLTLADFNGPSGDRIELQGAQIILGNKPFQGQPGEIHVVRLNSPDQARGWRISIDDTGNALADRHVDLPGQSIFKEDWLV